MSRDISLYLDDILDAIANVREFTAGMRFETVRASAPEIEWRKIAGLRNVLTHEYFGVDVRILWDVIDNKLPELEPAVRKLKAEVIE